MTTTAIERDHYGRPLVLPPLGADTDTDDNDYGVRQAVPYTRVTTLAKSLDDTYGLTLWKMRMVAVGLANRDDLLLAASAHRDDKRQLDRITKDAMEAAKASSAATTGTALHTLTEQLDRGEELPSLPPDAQAALSAYRQVTAPLDVIHIERFVVNDELQAAGTPDRVVEWNGRRYIADVKTGNVSYGLTIAQQLAIYSRSALYDHETGAREKLDVDQDLAIVIHLPAAEGTCQLHWVDISAGWEAAQVALQVRAWRKRDRYLIKPIEDAPAVDLEAAVAAAPSLDALVALYRGNEDSWTDELTDIASVRKGELMAAQEEGAA